MSCSVALAGSPAFSPSFSPCCKASPTSPSPAAMRFRLKRKASDLGELRNAVFSADPQPLLGESSGSRLKRNRPAMIEIPAVEEAAAAAALRSDGRREVEVEGRRCSVYCKRGKKRVVMEDRHCVDFDLGHGSKLAFFGVFDGHGGKSASEFASQKMGSIIGEELLGRGGECTTEVEEAVRMGYLRTDAEFLKEGKRGGACCVTALVRKGDVVVSNVGDCRAVLSRAGNSEAVTSDHKPGREDERERIENHGGYVDFLRGAWRLQGSLAVSRAIGDSHLKQWVIPEPETRIINLNDDCEFLILASDGLWDKVGNQEAVDIARQFCIVCDNPSPLSACKKLADLSAARGSVDDISVMIVQLQHFV